MSNPLELINEIENYYGEHYKEDELKWIKKDILNESEVFTDIDEFERWLT